MINPQLKLVIAGEVAPSLPDAIASRQAVDAEAARLGVNIHWTEGKQPVREVLENADVMVSCSAYEGLSLAHLEGISSGLPVVACDTGGTRELAWRNPAVSLLPLQASATDFAKSLADVSLSPPPSGHAAIWRDFTTPRMARRVTRLAHQGQRVRVALLQESPEHPTPRRKDLMDAGILVFVPPPAGLIEPEQAVDLLIAEIAADPPTSLVFWNAIITHKWLLADALPFTRVYDVSHGEMWFSSLERFLENPPPAVPYRSAMDYGQLLEGMILKYSAEKSKATMLGAPLQVIPKGINLPPARALSKLDRPFIFGTAARISPQKRLDELIDAFRIVFAVLPNSVLRIAGGIETGAEYCATQLQKISQELPIEWL